MPKRLPNIVLVLTDDQGCWALGCAGNTEVKTPHLDALAASGIRFTNFFCTSPVCSPARASIFTGRIPSQHGIHDWIRSGNVDRDQLPADLRDSPLFSSEKKAIDYLQGIPAYTESLTQAGYVCGLSGKWHLGDSLRPQKGFSHWFTIARGGADYMRPDLIRDGKVVIGDQYVTDMFTEDAIEFLEERAKEPQTPFYLSVHYTAPHSPWDREQHPADLLALYDDCPCLSAPEEPPHPWQSPTCPTPSGSGERRKELLRGYYAAISGVDRGIGRIREFLDRQGLLENTLFIFTSDNGMNLGHHGIWGKGNGTFPQNMYDTSVKIPMIIAQEGVIKGGRVCEALLSHYDLMPTLLEHLELSYPEGADPEKLPGRSFCNILQGNADSSRDLVVIYDEYGPVRMARTKDWKYIHRYPYGPHELYCLAEDPDERVNLIDRPEYADHQKELMKRMTDWFLQYVDPSLDGTKEEIYGFGQLALAGARANGEKAYASPPKKS